MDDVIFTNLLDDEMIDLNGGGLWEIFGMWRAAEYIAKAVVDFGEGVVEGWNGY